MKRILVTGAGGSASSNFVASLRMAPEPFYIIGADVRPFHLALADAQESYLLPRASDHNFVSELNRLIKAREIDMVHAQPDSEVAVLSARRDEIPARLFLPSRSAIELCQDKLAFAQALQDRGVPVAQSFPVNAAEDLPPILDALLARADRVWLRATRGAGSRAALPVRRVDHARAWIEYWADMRGVGWGDFMASEFLPGREFAFSGLWHNGELVTSQARERIEYLYGQLTASGQTSTPSIARTVSRDDVNEIAARAVRAVDALANGIYSVDLKENTQGVPCVTEINAGRFFTTSNFFSAAGLNMPYLYVRLAFGEQTPPLPRYNVLGQGLYWVRMVDMGFKLVRANEWAGPLSSDADRE
ncbi:MAG: ATP-grasp domain-containing protein [Anaerolineae bacterium]|nr:ATP-grasp domain-containing protein [Anaerolineae bacterium]